MGEPRFDEALRRAAAEWAAARGTPSLDERVLSSLRAGRGWPRTGLALLAGLATLVWLLATRTAPTLVAPAAAVPDVIFEPAACAPAVPAARLVLARGCTVSIVAPGLIIHAVETSELRRHSDGIRLVSGVVRFDASPVLPGAAPVVLFVSGGHIEVRGTRFEVRQDGAGGTVWLEEGRIEFVDPSGRRLPLEPGARHRWTYAPTAPPTLGPRAVVESSRAKASPAVSPLSLDRDAVPVPEVAGGPPGASANVAGRAPLRRAVEDGPDMSEGPMPGLEKVPPRAWSADQTAAAVRWVTRLRAERRYVEAVTWIGRLLEAPLDNRAAEVLSFERGQLLERKLADALGACRHWSAHAARFGSGHYDAEVHAALARCRGGNSGRGRQ
jgi:hypothetical protein